MQNSVHRDCCLSTSFGQTQAQRNGGTPSKCVATCCYSTGSAKRWFRQLGCENLAEPLPGGTLLGQSYPCLLSATLEVAGVDDHQLLRVPILADGRVHILWLQFRQLLLLLGIEIESTIVE